MQKKLEKLYGHIHIITASIGFEGLIFNVNQIFIEIWFALNFSGLGFINYDDEEDCIQGSGSGDGINNRPIDIIPREGGNGAYKGGPNGGSNKEEVFQVVLICIEILLP